MIQIRISRMRIMIIGILWFKNVQIINQIVTREYEVDEDKARKERDAVNHQVKHDYGHA